MTRTGDQETWFVSGRLLDNRGELACMKCSANRTLKPHDQGCKKPCSTELMALLRVILQVLLEIHVRHDKIPAW